MMAPPKIHVEGTQIKDALSSRVYLKGVDLDSGQWWDNTSIYSELINNGEFCTT